jgi:hypothetical protein
MLHIYPSGNPDSSFCAFSFEIPPTEQKAHNFHNKNKFKKKKLSNFIV